MFAVLFQVEPHPDRWDDYRRYAGMLRPQLERIDGFLDNRRFRSRRHDGRLLSLSLWRDEKALIRWRTNADHHAVQAAGRSTVFRDYRLRVGEVVRDNAVTPPQSRFDATEADAAGAVSVLEAPAAEVAPEAAGLVGWDMFDGVSDPADRLLLLSWRDTAAMLACAEPAASRRLDLRIVRSYGLRERTEAPQFHPPVRWSLPADVR